MRNKILREAREWLETPYAHQAMVKGVGVDCVGLIAGVGLAVGVTDLTRQDIKAYSGYGRLPNPRRMGQIIERHLRMIHDAEMDIGDIAWLQWREGMPMHLAIIGEHDGDFTLIHSLGDVGKVAEHTLTTEWNDRIVSFWRYPGLTQWLR